MDPSHALWIVLMGAAMVVAGAIGRCASPSVLADSLRRWPQARGGWHQ